MGIGPGSESSMIQRCVSVHLQRPAGSLFCGNISGVIFSVGQPYCCMGWKRNVLYMRGTQRRLSSFLPEASAGSHSMSFLSDETTAKLTKYCIVPASELLFMKLWHPAAGVLHCSTARANCFKVATPFSDEIPCH